MTVEEKRTCENCEFEWGRVGSTVCADCFGGSNWQPKKRYREKPAVNEAVAHPAHYAYSKYEPVHVIREWGLNFNLGNVVKYVARAGRKDDILQDLKKARQYIDFEIEALENET